MNFPFQLPIFIAVMLSLAGHINSQTPEAPLPPLAPPISAPTPDELQELGTFINLGQSTMAEAAESLENSYFEKYTRTGLVEYLMPKLIYGPAAREAKIEGELQLSLHNRRVLDALALVAAAAGCTLEPIPSLRESAEDHKKPQRVVGYYVTVATRPPGHASSFTPAFRDLPVGMSGNIGLTLGEQNGEILIRDVVPGLPAAQSKAIAPGEKLVSIAEEGAAEVRAADVGTEKVTEMLVGAPGTKVRVTVAPPHGEGQPRVVLLTREPMHPSVTPPHPPFVKVVDPLVDTFSFVSDDAKYARAAPGHSGSSPDLRSSLTDVVVGTSGAPPPSTGPQVRIYPVAFILSGDENQVAEKQKDLERLVMESLEHAKLHTDEGPLLSLHRGTKVLIVKATAAQHEIIQQIITALKENEGAGAQGSNSLRR